MLFARSLRDLGDDQTDLAARVLNVVFPLEVAQPYFVKMVLRFNDPDTQVVVVVYPDKEKYWVRRCEVTNYSLKGMDKGQLSQLISNMVVENPNVKEREIAAKLKVEVNRSLISPETLNGPLHELRAVRISPVLADRIALDEYSTYEFWYSDGQESVTTDSPDRSTATRKISWYAG